MGGNELNTTNMTATDFDKIIWRDALTFVDFFATWCGPCKAFAPTLEAVAQAYEGRVDVVKVDVDAEPELARQFRVMSIPTLVLMENGQVKEKRVGVQGQADVEAMLG